VPADGLFQSALRAPIADAAEIGIVVLPAPGTSLRCDTGVFELHRADPTTLFLAVDDVVYTLDRSTGALAPDTAPAGVVQRLLERHFTGDMSFDAARVASYSKWLTADLRQRIAAYFTRKRDPGEVPPINGDPFTNSQEPPTRFSVALGTARGDTAMVPVQFGFERSTSQVTYVLRREGGTWRVDDLRLQRRGGLRQLLAH
jgi:hypothetical protein